MCVHKRVPLPHCEPAGILFAYLFYLSLRLPLELLPVDPARVRLPLDSPESFRVRLPTCSLELALLTVLAETRGGKEMGVSEVNSTPSAVRCAKCAFQLHHRQPDSPPFATIKMLHQQSIGQQALSPNPARGRKVHSKPKTVIPFWRACVVCWLKSRTERRAKRESDGSLLAPEDSW